MEQSKESFMSKYNVKSFLVAIGMVAATMCVIDLPDTEGEGNDFDVTVRVEGATAESITGSVLQIDQTDGAAEEFFDEIGESHEFHDNCNCRNRGRVKVRYGSLFDADGTEIAPNSVPDGVCIELSGKIRESRDSIFLPALMVSERPVYEVAQVVRCD